MNLNPIALIDDLLTDWASPRIRRAVHTLITLLLALVAIWFAVDGDWVQFAIALGGMVYTEANRTNTPATDLLDADEIEPDDGESYEDADGEPYPEIHGQELPLFQPGSDGDGFGGDAPIRVR